MTLNEYLASKDLTKYRAAKELGVNYVTLWRWTKGHGRPCASTMHKIAGWSGGAVMPNDWLMAAQGGEA